MDESKGGVNCPVCDAPFDTQRGMEAHVSGSGGDHEGMVGRDVRDELKGAIEFPDNAEADTTGDDLAEALDELDDDDVAPEAGVDGGDELEVEDRSDSDGPLKAVVGWVALVAVVGAVWSGGLDSGAERDESEIVLL